MMKNNINNGKKCLRCVHDCMALALLHSLLLNVVIVVIEYRCCDANSAPSPMNPDAFLSKVYQRAYLKMYSRYWGYTTRFYITVWPPISYPLWFAHDVLMSIDVIINRVVNKK
jgi:hypothetical protein